MITIVPEQAPVSDTAVPCNIKSFGKEGLFSLIKQLKQPAFRAKQLYLWLYKQGISDYSEMTNIPHSLIQILQKDYPLSPLSLESELISSDGTRKYLFSLPDGNMIEAVAIPSSKNQWTVCCSTQVGCPMACAFCATGREGFTRNLLPGEILDQILFIQNRISCRISHVVFMGQGEPFLNYQNSIAALSIINDPETLGIGARHITVSTCGIIPSIEKFSFEPQQYTLAISLHSAKQETRDTLMPYCSNYPLTYLKETLQNYISRTNRRVSFEYALIKGVNDSDDDLQALLRFCNGLLCHVNLIPLNDIEESEFKPSPLKVLQSWENTLNREGISTTIRDSKGSDITGACGQLKNKRE